MPPLQRSIHVILNGSLSPQIHQQVDQDARAIGELGHDIEIVKTVQIGDAQRLAAAAVDRGFDVIVAGGGDGTLNEVVNGMLTSGRCPRSALALLPLGTANDFASSCGLAAHDPLAALQLAASGPVRTIDVGRCDQQYFINVASGGFGAEVTTQTPKSLKSALGPAAYALMGIVAIPRLVPLACRLRLADGRQMSGEMFVIAIGNGPQCGGGRRLTPRALLDDGLLDALFVHDVNWLSFGTAAAEWVMLPEDGSQNVSYLQTESLEMEAETPFQMNLDGDPVKRRRFHFEIVPAALRCILPAAAPCEHTLDCTESATDKDGD